MWHVCPSMMREGPQAKIRSSWHQHARHAPAVLAPDLLLANTMADRMHSGEHTGGRGLGLAIRDTLHLGVTEVALDQRDQTHVVFANSAVSFPVNYLLAPFDGDCADPCDDRESDGGGLARRHCASTLRWAPTPWAARPIAAIRPTTWKQACSVRRWCDAGAS